MRWVRYIELFRPMPRLQAIQARCGFGQNLPLFADGQVRNRLADITGEGGIIGPDFLDREIRAPQAALGAERRDGVADDRLDVGERCAMHESAERRELDEYIGTIGKLLHP